MLDCQTQRKEAWREVRLMLMPMPMVMLRQRERGREDPIGTSYIEGVVNKFMHGKKAKRVLFYYRSLTFIYF